MREAEFHAVEGQRRRQVLHGMREAGVVPRGACGLVEAQVDLQRTVVNLDWVLLLCRIYRELDHKQWCSLMGVHRGAPDSRNSWPHVLTLMWVTNCWRHGSMLG